MISVYKRLNGKMVPGRFEDIKSAAFVWCNVINPTNEEINALGDIAKIPVEQLKISITKDVRPTIYEYDDYYSIFFDSHSTNSSTNFPIGIFALKNNTIITVAIEPVAALEKAEARARENKVDFFSSQGMFIKHLLSLIVSDYFKVLDAIEESVDKSEVQALENPTTHSAKAIFENKKKLFIIHKSLIANRDVVLAIEDDQISKIPKKERLQFRSVYEDIISIIDLEETLRDISTGVLDVYLTSVSNGVNITVKKMTAWGSLVLVPTLIASIYGMNFLFMPELAWKYGYAFSLGLMAVSVGILYLLFKRGKYL